MAGAGEEAQEGLKYQTSVLKVSIHCEGCKRAVKKALQAIDGVYTITVDSQQHKATVTGNVTGEALVKKLLKIGKHAELLPDNQNNSSISSNKNNKKKNKNKKEETSEPQENPSDKQTTTSTADHSETPKKQGKVNGETPKTAVQESPNSGDNAKASGGSGGGDNKKNEQKEKNMDTNKMAGEAHKAGSGYLPMYPQPAYIMSYSTAHPSSSYGAAYYPMPMPHSGYTYSVYPPPPGAYIASPEVLSLPSLMPESYVASEDENAAGCIVM